MDEGLTPPSEHEDRPAPGKLTNGQWMVRFDTKLDLLADAISRKADMTVVEAVSHRTAILEMWIAERRGQEEYGRALVGEFKEVQRTLAAHLQTPHFYAADAEKKREFSLGTMVGVISAVIAALGVVALVIGLLLKP